MPPDDALVKDAEAYRRMMEPLEGIATVQDVSSASELLAIIQSPPFNDARWAFRGHGDAERLLKASIERIATKPGIAEDYVEREFKRRATLFPGLDGFARSLRTNTEILDWEDWPS